MDIIVISRSIGHLKQTVYNHRGFDGNSHKCYFTSELIRSWFDYGKKYTYQYELFTDGESKPIELNGTIFDNKIEYYLDTNSALSNGHYHVITLSGKNAQGEVFETSFGWNNKYGGDLNTSTTIIYCLILTSIFGQERIKNLFFNSFGQIKLEDKNLGDLILMVDDIKSIFDTAKRDYDFFNLFYQQCIKHVVEVTQRKLEDFKILSD